MCTEVSKSCGCRTEWSWPFTPSVGQGQFKRPWIQGRTTKHYSGVLDPLEVKPNRNKQIGLFCPPLCSPQMSYFVLDSCRLPQITRAPTTKKKSSCRFKCTRLTNL